MSAHCCTSRWVIRQGASNTLEARFSRSNFVASSQSCRGRAACIKFGEEIRQSFTFIDALLHFKTTAPQSPNLGSYFLTLSIKTWGWMGEMSWVRTNFNHRCSRWKFSNFRYVPPFWNHNALQATGDEIRGQIFAFYDPL